MVKLGEEIHLAGPKDAGPYNPTPEEIEFVKRLAKEYGTDITLRRFRKQ